MLKSVKSAPRTKNSSAVPSLSFGKAHGGSLFIKYQGGVYCIGFKSKTIQAYGWGDSLPKAYQNMLKDFEIKKDLANEMSIRKRLLQTIFAPNKKSNKKTVA